MGLYARITSTGADKIGVHRFGAALRLWAAGHLTRAQVIGAFNLTDAGGANEITQLDALKATYDALGTGNALAAFTKAQYLDKMEDVFLLCETNDLTANQAATFLGF